LRINVYQKKREIVLKLATNIVDEGAIRTAQLPSRSWKFDEMVLTWDLSKDYQREDGPDDVVKCIMMSKRFVANKCRYLPHFSSVSRSNMMFSLVTSNQPVKLRSLLYNRNQI